MDLSWKVVQRLGSLFAGPRYSLGVLKEQSVLLTIAGRSYSSKLRRLGERLIIEQKVRDVE